MKKVVIEEVAKSRGFVLKEKQKKVVLNFVNGNDVFVSLPTGYGKSLCYLLLPMIYNAIHKVNNTLVVVISPLISLMEDQVESCKRIGVLGVAVTSHRSSVSCQDVVSREDIQVLFLSPEMAIGSKRWRRFFNDDALHSRLKAIVVDEVHCVKTWGDEFRESYKRVGEIRSLLPKEIHLMALTATASNTTRQECCKILGIANPVVVEVSPDKPNIRYTCKEFTTFHETFGILADKLNVKRNGMERVIIFCKRRDMCNRIYSFFNYMLKERFTEPPGSPVEVPGHRLVDMFLSGTQPEVKTEILRSFKDPNSNLRIVIATIAFGLGIDCPNIREIIHVGPPSDVESYIQHVGRAGRDNANSCAVLLYGRNLMENTSDSLKKYCGNTEVCRRLILFSDCNLNIRTEITSGCMCCDICQKNCKCENCDVISNKFNRNLPQY